MDEVLKDKWIKALTSRKYRQGTGSLHLEEDGRHTYCCLGVLCDVAGIKPTKKVDINYTTYRYDSLTSMLTVNLRRKLGISNEAIDILVRMNDDDRAKFYQIARWIKRNL